MNFKLNLFFLLSITLILTSTTQCSQREASENNLKGTPSPHFAHDSIAVKMAYDTTKINGLEVILYLPNPQKENAKYSVDVDAFLKSCYLEGIGVIGISYTSCHTSELGGMKTDSIYIDEDIEIRFLTDKNGYARREFYKKAGVALMYYALNPRYKEILDTALDSAKVLRKGHNYNPRIVK